uniref:Reverse transcriptase domain-containing protein n=1 Tax=Tanacetum cinerariifolium TaxID=118510 RepID=A0A6L2JKD4_TANCI|nr:reverse transcriptase domain-containing protein [Tanacetum cinerariifolium]
MPVEFGRFDAIIGMDWLLKYRVVIVCDEKIVQVFPEDLSGVPSTRQVEFQIDLVPGDALVALAPYGLAPSEMKELSNKLQELSDKGFIRPSLAGYYQRFIKGFSKISKPMTKLTQKSVKYEWGDKEEEAFQLLKQKLCSAPILALPEGTENFVVYCDASHKGECSGRCFESKRTDQAITSLSLSYDIGLNLLVQILNAQVEVGKAKNITTEDLGGNRFYGETDETLLEKVVSRHGVPVSIISNCDSKSTSHFWLSLQTALGTHLNMSMAYHPQTDGQSERTIQTLEDTLHICVIDFENVWDKHLPLVEFLYNNNYNTSIKAAPFEALYGRKCRSPVCWAEVEDVQLTSLEIVHETTKKIVQIKSRIQAARDCHKSYTDVRCKPLEFQVGDKVMFKVSPWKGVIRFGKRGMLNLRRTCGNYGPKGQAVEAKPYSYHQGLMELWERPRVYVGMR